MNDQELKNTWNSYDRKLEEASILNRQSWALNLRVFETMQTDKAKSKLDSLAAFKTGAVVLGVLWSLFLGVLVWGNWFQNPYFTVSIAMIMLFSVIATVVYIKHIILIRRLNYSDNILVTQQKLAELQTSTINTTRIVWLQLPFHTTWFWSSKWIIYSSIQFWLIPFPILLFFIAVTIYLYRNLKPANMHKKWVRKLMMAGPEYRSVMKASAFLAEIEEFKKDN